MPSKRFLKSIAVIPDGNRRYAKKYELSIEEAYKSGFQNIRDFTNWLEGTKTREVTFWAMSLDNFTKRSKTELDILFTLMQSHVEEAFSSREWVDKNTRVKFFGKREMLPSKLVEKMAVLEEKTRDCDSLTVNIALAYSGKEEILQAVNKIAREAQQAQKSGLHALDALDENKFNKYLYYPNSPDLIIRTGGVQRLSGFLPWQSEYSEIYFSPKLWPEFSRLDLTQAIEFYKESEARYGK